MMKVFELEITLECTFDDDFELKDSQGHHIL